MNRLRQLVIGMLTTSAIIGLAWSSNALPYLVPCNLAPQPSRNYEPHTVEVTFRSAKIPSDVPFLARLYGGTSIEPLIQGWMTTNGYSARTFLVKGNNLNVGGLVCALSLRSDVESSSAEPLLFLCDAH